MKLNIQEEVNQEISYFAIIFQKYGWEIEDTSCLLKDVDFVVNPTGVNEEWKRKLTIEMFPSILSYVEKIPSKGGNYVTKIWIECKLSWENDGERTRDFWKDETAKKIADYITKELETLGLTSFFDEDSFRSRFSRPKVSIHNDIVSMSFYLNKDYPQGYWSNHTL